MLKPVLSTVVAMVTLATGVEAQAEWLGRPAVSTDSVSRSIPQAEARGRRHPRALVNNTLAAPSMTTVNAPAERRCVDADADRVRSGDFLAGPFAAYNEIWRGGYGKLWWHPSEMTPEPPVLIVQATRLDQEAENRVFQAKDIAWPSGPNESSATRLKFYPTGIRLPTVGRWMRVATAGNNWGCFVLTVR